MKPRSVTDEADRMIDYRQHYARASLGILYSAVCLIMYVLGYAFGGSTFPMLVTFTTRFSKSSFISAPRYRFSVPSNIEFAGILLSPH